MTMHTISPPFPPAATALGSLEITVSAAANDRYWAGAGIDHPVRAEGLLFPPMAVNFTMLLVQQTVREGVLHTWGTLRSHAVAPADQAVTITGSVQDRFVKRGRDYFVVDASVHDSSGELLWTAQTELAASRKRAGAADTAAPTRAAGYPAPADARSETQTLTMSADLLRTYSRAGNFHSDDSAAQAMGLPGMTAMGMQTLGPGYGALLDAWGSDLVERGAIEARFFGLVLEDDTVEVTVHRTDDRAVVAVRNATKNADTAAGRVGLA